MEMITRDDVKSERIIESNEFGDLITVAEAKDGRKVYGAWCRVTPGKVMIKYFPSRRAAKAAIKCERTMGR